MEQDKILRQMCQSELSKADIAAICKNRGFSSRIASSISLLEGSFLSSAGVRQVMDSLSRDEVIILHYLKFLRGVANVSVFSTIYKAEQPVSVHQTFNQNFKGIFNEVKKNLVRKGILLFAENKGILFVNTKLERTFFVFPKEFYPYLPPIFETTVFNHDPGENTTADLKQVLIDDLKKGSKGKDNQNLSCLFSIQDGQLLFDDTPFSMDEIRKWQFAAWKKALEKSQKGYYSYAPVTPVVTAVNHALSFLEENQWIKPEQLQPVLNVFRGNTPQVNPQKICEQGWKYGCLNRSVVKGQTVYRPALPESEPDKSPSSYKYLTLNSRSQAVVDPAKITLEDMEALSRISSFVIDENRLTVSPNLIRMGREMEKLTGQPLFEWVVKNVHAYEKAAETIRKRLGKIMVHKGLMVARVRDVTLRVAIMRAFDDSYEVVFLNDEYVAFPEGLAAEITNVVQKSGHVIKTITA